MAVNVGESIPEPSPRWLNSQKSRKQQRKKALSGFGTKVAKDRLTQRRWISGESSKECKIFKVVWRKLE